MRTEITHIQKKFIRDNRYSLTVKQISEELGIKIDTVYAHLKSIGVKPHKMKKETWYLKEPVK
jgi:hypothetical protein